MVSIAPSADRLRNVVFAGARALQAVAAVNYSAPAGPDAAPEWRCTGISTEGGSFIHWLFGRAGLDLRDYRIETLTRRLPACLRALRAVSPAHARWLIEQRPLLAHTALSSMVIGVTSFFRDPAVYADLGELLPGLYSGRNGPRIWSAGCSDGSELYSVAMLLADFGLLHRFYLLGTDCRIEAVRRAVAGAYDGAGVRCVPPPMLEKYFVREGPAWQVRSWLRTCVQWRTASVLHIREPGRWDVILCRNMAMYLRAEATLRLWVMLEEVLAPGGLLVVGKADRPVGVQRLKKLSPCIYRKES